MISNGKFLFSIDPKAVKSITYSGITYIKPIDSAKTYAVMAATGYGAFFALLTLARSGAKDHLVAIEYDLPNGQPSGVLLRLHKKNHQAIARTLKVVTGADKPTDLKPEEPAP